MNRKVILALLLVSVTLFSTSSSRKSKDTQGKAVSLKSKLHQKIFHHHDHPHHHHHHNHHHPHVHYNHDKHKHPHHHNHHHHHHHHHDRHNPLKHYHHYSHHHRHPPHPPPPPPPHHHHHNPLKHYFHNLHHHRHSHHHHQGHNHHHHHRHPLHQQPKEKLQPKLQPDHVNHHDNRRSHISHPLQLNVPSKLKLHVQINNAQAVKRNSLPELLSSLGQNLVKLGTSMSHKTAQSEVIVNSSDGLDRKGDVTHALPVPQFSFGAEGLSSNSAVIPAHALGKSVTAKDLEVLLHRALDGASGDHIDSASGSGSRGELADTNTNVSPTDKGYFYYQNQSSIEKPGRRNETFPDEPGYHSSEGRGEYDSEYRTQNSPSTHDQAAKESVQRDTKGPESDDKELSQFFRDERVKNVASKKTYQAEMADTQAKQFGQIHDNGSGSKPSSLTNQSLLEEPRRPDMNATFEDTEGNADKERNKSDLKQHLEPDITQNDDQDTSENKEEKTGASGSGDEASAESNDGTDEHTEAEEKLYRGEVNVKELSNVPIIDKDENGSGDSLGQNDIRNTGDGKSGQEVLINQMAKQEPFYESNTTVAEGTLDKQTKESRNQNEASLDQDRTNEPQSRGSIDASASTESTIDQPAPKESKAFSQTTTAKDVDVLPSGDFQTPMTQSVLDESARVKLRTKVEKDVATEKEGTAILDANYQQNQLNQFNQLDRLAQTKPDEVSGSQEEAEENALKDDLRPQIYNATFSDGPSFNTAYSTGIDAEGNQSADLHEVTSPENSSIDDTDEIPVYTLSSPRSEDAVENTVSPVFTTPTSSITTASATYLEPALPTEEETTFTTLDTPPQDEEERYTPPTERIGFQRDMLDDPVEESLETTVDSKSS